MKKYIQINRAINPVCCLGSLSPMDLLEVPDAREIKAEDNFNNPLNKLEIYNRKYFRFVPSKEQ